MGFDLCVFAPTASQPGDSKTQTLARLRQLTDEVVDTNLQAFIDKLTVRYPAWASLSPDQIDQSPWCHDFERGPAHAYFSVLSERSAELKHAIKELANEFQLVVFDPQKPPSGCREWIWSSLGFLKD